MTHIQSNQVNNVKLPHVWLVIGDKLGDNAQVDIIANALGWPCEHKQLYFKSRYITGKPGFKASLYHVDISRSDSLEPPWPDLIITIGRRPSMAVMWVRERSEGKTKVVILGRPRRWVDRYDLAIVSSQYRVPRLQNVLRLNLPLMRPNEKKIDAAKLAWEKPLSRLQRPIIAMLIGGPTRPYIFDALIAEELLSRAKKMLDDLGGTLYITTSRRTPAKVVKALEDGLPEGSRLYRWGENPEENPYLGLLGLADYFIVTGDSISMMVEVVRRGKPLAIFPLPSHRLGIAWQWLTSLLHGSIYDKENTVGVFKSLSSVLYRIGWVGYSRDLGIVHQYLKENNFAVELGDGFQKQHSTPPDELGHVVTRIKSLFRSGY